MGTNDKQLLEMLKMQEELDNEIFEKHGLTEYPKEKVEVALFVELGELMNEQQSLFKYWRDNPKDNRENALEEYIDCIHFMLSLTINYCREKNETYEQVIKKILKHTSLPFVAVMKWSKLLFEISHIGYIAYARFGYLLKLGDELGFTWEEIYNCYKMKNEKNHRRQEVNY